MEFDENAQFEDPTIRACSDGSGKRWSFSVYVTTRWRNEGEFNYARRKVWKMVNGVVSRMMKYLNWITSLRAMKIAGARVKKKKGYSPINEKFSVVT